MRRAWPSTSSEFAKASIRLRPAGRRPEIQREARLEHEPGREEEFLVGFIGLIELVAQTLEIREAEPEIWAVLEATPTQRNLFKSL